MSAARARKEASKRLGIAIMRDYRALVEARDQDEIQIAAIQLGNTFNTNIEFIINVLKAYGGLDVTFEPLTKPKSGIVGMAPANDQAFPKVPAIFIAGADVDMKRKY